MSVTARAVARGGPKRVTKAATAHNGRAATAFKARNPTQQLLVDMLRGPGGPVIVVATGAAGTGKTLCAAAVGVSQLLRGAVSKIVIARPAVSSGEEHGFLPGDIVAKMAPWARPVTDSLLKARVTPEELQGMLSEDVIELCPLAYCRGRTFERSWMMLDEAQNCTSDQVLMFMTRIGEGSTLVITGDTEQSDLGPTNGLADLLRRLGRPGGDTGRIGHVAFDSGDVVRHEVIPDVLALYRD